MSATGIHVLSADVQSEPARSMRNRPATWFHVQLTVMGFVAAPAAAQSVSQHMSLSSAERNDVGLMVTSAADIVSESTSTMVVPVKRAACPPGPPPCPSVKVTELNGLVMVGAVLRRVTPIW